MIDEGLNVRREDLVPDDEVASTGQGLRAEVVSTGSGRTVRAVGVDGCRGGWVAAWIAQGRLNARFHETFAGLVAAYPHVACIAVDIPIGLSIAGARACDRAARALLGPRASSVFPAPDPRVLGEPDFAAVNERSRELTGKGVSVQAFGIFPKVAEVGELMTPSLQNWVVEVHPELSFRAMAGGRPMAHSKSSPSGYDERRGHLERELGVPMPSKPQAHGLVKEASPDDVLDAAAALWTARRAADGLAGRVPEQPELDRRGLRMEMVY